MPFPRRPTVAAAVAALAAALLGGCLPQATTPGGIVASTMRTLGVATAAGDRKGHKVDVAPVAP